MIKENISAQIDEAARDIAALVNLLECVINPAFDGATRKFLFEHRTKWEGKSWETVATEWMERHYDKLLSACEAAELLAIRATTILQMLPQVVEAPKERREAET